MLRYSCANCKYCIRYETNGMTKNRCDLIQKDLTRLEIRHYICNSFKYRNINGTKTDSKNNN